jgi:arylsulfatase A-like enzyme
MPGTNIGLQAQDPTIAELLKPLGYVSGQFGKNHLGDKDEFLPSNHGFDEFLGNLYHLNAEEEPETYFYPKDPEFRKKISPRGVIHSYADGRIEDTGPLSRKRMERQMKNLWERLCHLSTERTTRKSHFLSGLTPHACMSGRDSHPSGRAAQAMVYTPTA